LTLLLELTPEESARLASEAQRSGKSAEALLRNLIAHLPSSSPLYENAQEEWEDFMDELAAGGEKLPVLPIEAYDRENLYEDRL
jgi:hypothetical protein